MLRLIDTHAHLDEIENLEKVISEAEQVGITAIIAVGQDYESNQKVLDLAQKYIGFVYPALGLHPWNIDTADEERDLVFIEANTDRVVGIGEIGLDYHKRVRQRADKNIQAQVLRRLLSIAKYHNKPALVHSRYAWRDALALVRESGIEKAVFHWYTGTSSVLRGIIDSGYYISVTPAVEYHEEHRRAVRATPSNRLLLETDAPVTYGRGTEREFEARPSDVLRSLKATSTLIDVDESRLAESTTVNAINLFDLQQVH